MVQTIIEKKRMRSPLATPQALAWHEGKLWIGSRDERKIASIDPERWSVIEEFESPGIPWAATSAGDEMWFNLGEGKNDDRYLRRFEPGRGFGSERIPCPDFTGSYLSYDGSEIYVSQWYEHRILKLDRTGKILQTIDVGAEICGHTFVDGRIFVLRGTEEDGEDWTLAEFDPTNPRIKDLAKVPFAARSLAFDGNNFWSNHRAAHETVSFALS